MVKQILLSLSLLQVGSSFGEAKHLVINARHAKKIGMQIWHNETSKRKDLLVFWNEHESFPSFGIGHNIWMVDAGGDSLQQFPVLCDYFEKHKVVLPKWLQEAKKTGLPWRTREEFLADQGKAYQLRNLLSETVDLQVSFMLERLEQWWKVVLQKTSEDKKAHLIKNFGLMRSSLLGTYALVDYLNFKGGGLNSDQNGYCHCCGLVQVLSNMPDNLTSKNVNAAFALSAAKSLLQLIERSGPNYRQIRFLDGWMKRVSTYADHKLAF